MNSATDHSDQKDIAFLSGLSSRVGGAVFLFVVLGFVCLLFDPNEALQADDVSQLNNERMILMNETSSTMAWDHVREIDKSTAVLPASGRSNVISFSPETKIESPWATVESKLLGRGWSKCEYRHPTELFKFGKGRYRVSGYLSNRQGSQMDVSFHLRRKQRDNDCQVS